MRWITKRVAMVGTVFGVAVAGSGQAQESASPAASGSGTSCILSGEAIVPADAEIFSQASGGQAIAKFSGAKAPLKVTNFPADVSSGRAQVNTGSGFRVEGFIDPRALRVFGVRDVVVVPGRVWISAGVPLKIVGASPGQLRVEMDGTSQLSRPLQTTVSCEALTLSTVAPPPPEPAGNARGYVTKDVRLDLYAEPGGSPIRTLEVTNSPSILLWGKEVRSGYVHVTSRTSLYIDAWVKASDVRALPRGETMDQLLPSTRVRNPPRLALQQFDREMRAPKEVILHFGRGAATPAIGVIERDTELYVLDRVLGWASVLPKQLHVLPTGERSFWVDAAQLGIQSAAANAGVGKK